MSQLVSLSAICEQAGVSDRTARRLLSNHNDARGYGGHHRFKPEEVPQVLAFIASKRKRNCLNRFNAIRREEAKTQ